MAYDPTLTAEDDRVFKQFYEKRRREADSAGDEARELEIARDILQAAIRDGLTPTADGGVSNLRPGTTDWGNEATVRAAQKAAGGGGRGARPAAGGKGSLKESLQGVLMLAAALGLAAYFFWPKSAPVKVVSKTVTPPAAAAAAGEVTPTPLPTLQAELLAGIVGDGQTGLVAPRTLDIKGVSFVVQPVKITAGDWPLPEDERAVSWVAGTVVNYVLGLEATPANQALLAALTPGDELLLRMSTGPTYRFTFADAVRVAPQASEIFRQTRPGLTLALVGGAEPQATRVVIRAAYVPDSELAGDPALGRAAAAAVGQTTPLDALAVTCLGARPQASPETPPGQVYLAVDYRVSHISGELPLLTGSFFQRLEAGGLTLPLAPGAPPALPLTLQAGQSLTATATYIAPETALAGGLTWYFAASAGGPAARVNLPPYPGPLAPRVTINQAELQGGRLSVRLGISAALREVSLSAADIQVQGGALNLAQMNAFPWRVPPGQTGEFTLALTPQANPLRLGLLQQGFELAYPVDGRR